MAEQTLEQNLPDAELTESESRDLGFGAVVTRGSRQRLLNHEGTFNIRRTGLSLLSSLNLYQTLFAVSWKVFLSLAVVWRYRR